MCCGGMGWGECVLGKTTGRRGTVFVWWCTVYGGVCMGVCAAAVLPYLTTIYRISSKRNKRDRIHSTPLNTISIYVPNAHITMHLPFVSTAPTAPTVAFTLMANRLHNRAHMTSGLAPQRSQVLGQVQVKLGARGGRFVWFGGLGGLGGDMSSPPSLTRSL